MPATMYVLVRVTESEHASLVKKYGKGKLGPMLRNMLGLPPRKLGRPPKPKPRSK